MRQDEFITLKEAARELRLSVSTLKRYIYAGQLTSYRTPGGRHRVKRFDLPALLGAAPPAEATPQPAPLMQLDDFADQLASRISRSLDRRLARLESDVERLECSIDAITAALRRAASGGAPPARRALSQDLEIKVLGPGCRACDQLADLVMQIARAAGLHEDAVRRVRDIEEIAEYGPTPMPALLINNELVSAGRLPTRTRLAKLLEEHRPH